MNHKILPTCWPWGDVLDTFFDNGGKYVTMVTAYQGKNMGKTLRIELLPHFLGIESEIWHTWWPYGVVVQNTLFDSGGYYAKNWGGNAFQIKFGIHVDVEV